VQIHLTAINLSMFWTFTDFHLAKLVIKLEEMARVPRFIAADLIQFAKAVKITADYWDPKAKSAFEFYRQMHSRKLKKINPVFDCTINVVEESKIPAKLEVEYLDGSKWSTNTDYLTAAQLRHEFYTRAAEAEDNVDITSSNDGDGGGAGKKGGDKGGKSGGKK
jgi:hypothetical protein